MKGPFKIARFIQESFLHMLLVLAQSRCGNEGSAALCAAPPAAYTGLLSPPGPPTPALHILLLQSSGGIPQCVKIRKCMLKNGDITLSTKVHLLRAMVFPVVMYGCESRTVKKTEH